VTRTNDGSLFTRSAQWGNADNQVEDCETHQPLLCQLSEIQCSPHASAGTATSSVSSCPKSGSYKDICLPAGLFPFACSWHLRSRSRATTLDPVVKQLALASVCVAWTSLETIALSCVYARYSRVRELGDQPLLSSRAQSIAVSSKACSSSTQVKQQCAKRYQEDCDD
jgi:hypothetical protein